jgi:hypothetical protein
VGDDGVTIWKSGKSILRAKEFIDVLAIPSYPKASNDGILYFIPLLRDKSTGPMTIESSKDFIDQQLSIIQFGLEKRKPSYTKLPFLYVLYFISFNYNTILI